MLATLSSHCWRISLGELHVPEEGRSKLQNIADVLSKCRRLGPFTPRDISDFVERNPLDFIGKALPFRLTRRTAPFGHKLFDLRDIRPTEPSA